MSSELEQFNAHQEDVRRRADSFVRAIFLLSGGALTLSVGLFAGGKVKLHDPSLVSWLKWSWWGLFLAILLLSGALVAIIARDYAFGERWRKQLDSPSGSEAKHYLWPECLIWGLAIGGFGAFVAGMLGLAWVATSYVGSAGAQF